MAKGQIPGDNGSIEHNGIEGSEVHSKIVFNVLCNKRLIMASFRFNF